MWCRGNECFGEYDGGEAADRAGGRDICGDFHGDSLCYDRGSAGNHSTGNTRCTERNCDRFHRSIGISPGRNCGAAYSLEILSETYNNITFADEWYNASEDVSLPMIGENWDCFYDENYTYQWDDGKLSIFDGENCLYVLEYPTDKWYVNGNNARLENGIFYGASVMNGYAQPDTCFMFAYDLENEKLLWRSATRPTTA
mgnify:CR=1 FL=1